MSDLTKAMNVLWIRKMLVEKFSKTSYYVNFENVIPTTAFSDFPDNDAVVVTSSRDQFTTVSEYCKVLEVEGNVKIKVLHI